MLPYTLLSREDLQPHGELHGDQFPRSAPQPLSILGSTGQTTFDYMYHHKGLASLVHSAEEYDVARRTNRPSAENCASLIRRIVRAAS